MKSCVNLENAEPLHTANKAIIIATAHKVNACDDYFAVGGYDPNGYSYTIIFPVSPIRPDTRATASTQCAQSIFIFFFPLKHKN